jgi:enoyl-CoA hydratase/carnithine racemase
MSPLPDRTAAAPLLVDQRADVRWLRLNRPDRRNALNPELVAAIDREIAAAAGDAGTRLVVISGEGASFCAGADLRHLRLLADTGGPQQFLETVSRCFTRIERCPKPVLAVVHGHVVAGGLELALACDVVVAETGTLIGDGHVRNGLVPAGGSTVRLPRKVGEPLARWLLLSGELLPAEALVATGLVHEVAPAEELPDVLDRLIHRLRRSSGSAQARVKEQLRVRHELPEDAALTHELSTFTRHWQTSDVTGALTKFIDGDGRWKAGDVCEDSTAEQY